MEIFFFWIILSFVVGMIGSGRKIGFGGSFFLSLIFSPLIGILFALLSENKETTSSEKLLNTIAPQQQTLNDYSYSLKTNSITDELEKLRMLKDNNSITLEEYNQLKSKIINS